MPLNTDGTNGDPLAFLARWSDAVAAALAAQLPADRFAAGPSRTTRAQAADAVAALAEPVEAAPALLAPARLTDRLSVEVTDTATGGAAAAVLFVTPDNKADSDGALAFAVRAAGLMSSGAGVVIVDALPGPAGWATHLHSLTGVYPIAKRARGADAPVLAVHPTIQNGSAWFAVWPYTVAPGFPLPTVPVAVRGAMHLKLDLEATYADAHGRGHLS
ncbi:MAG: hypothetical protein ACKODX_23440 [Gemmata sp.]